MFIVFSPLNRKGGYEFVLGAESRNKLEKPDYVGKGGAGWDLKIL